MKLPSLLLFFLIPAALLAQDVRKYRAKTTSIKMAETEWSEPKPCDILIVAKDKRFTVYSDAQPEFDVSKFAGRQYDTKFGESLAYECIDKYGTECLIMLFLRKNGAVYLFSVSYPKTNDMVLFEVDEL